MNRIRRHGRGWAFTSKDFLDLASRSAVGAALRRLIAKGEILQVSRGVYAYPKQHAELGTLFPSQDQIAKAVARATGDRIWPTGASAANALGLTTQVPARPWYVTTGKPRKIRVGDRCVIELHSAKLPKTLTHYMAYMVLQALDNLGPRIVDQSMIDKCAKYLKPADKKDIEQNLRYIRNPWLADIARQLIV